MIVYSESKQNFVAHVESNRIHELILQEFTRRLHHSVSPSEIDSWRNSMQYMANAVRTDEIPGDAHVSIEFNIPLTSKRVDFILSGKDGDRRDIAVIVELKQWSEVTATTKDAIVMTHLGGGLRETPHPSYQAWVYAALIEDYNQTVRDEQIRLQPCSYLHNLCADDVIRDARYEEHIAKAPAFLSPDAVKLREFLSRHVRYGDTDKVMYRIEHGRIKPSKSLADALSGMLEGNAEFLMVDEQKMVYETAIDLVHKAHSGPRQVLIVSGGPGTGKSVVSINLLVELTRREMVAQYVTRNAAPRQVYEERLVGTMKKSRISNLFRGSGAYTDTAPRTFDALIVDEAHRLNEKSGLYANLGENQIKELISASKFSIFFLDEDQRVTLKDIGTDSEIVQHAESLGAHITRLELSSQFRCNGSDAYIAFLSSALQIRQTANTRLSGKEFDFRVLDTATDLHDEIRKRNALNNKARVVAGYCWDWRSKKDPDGIDISLDDGAYTAQWNLSQDGGRWIIAEDSVEQVGCIHTCQGLELDYVGVIIGPDLIVRDGEIQTDGSKRSRMDSSIKGYKSWLKNESKSARAAASRIIKNTYRTLMTRGQKGCYLYCTDIETAEYFRQLIEVPIATVQQDVVVSSSKQLHGLSWPEIDSAEAAVSDRAVRILDLKAAAGAFSHDQTVDEIGWARAPADWTISQDMFIAQVQGESMSRKIPKGSWCLFRFNPPGSRNGKIVLVGHRDVRFPDTDERFTVKVYESQKGQNALGDPETIAILLKPASFDRNYVPIRLDPADAQELRVVAEFIEVIS